MRRIDERLEIPIVTDTDLKHTVTGLITDGMEWQTAKINSASMRSTQSQQRWKRELALRAEL